MSNIIGPRSLYSLQPTCTYTPYLYCGLSRNSISIYSIEQRTSIFFYVLTVFLNFFCEKVVMYENANSQSSHFCFGQKQQRHSGVARTFSIRIPSRTYDRARSDDDE